MPDCLEGRHVLEVVVSGVQRLTGKSRLDVRVLSTLDGRCAADLQGQRLRLTDYGDRRWSATNDPLRIEVKLRRPWGAANPGSFRYEAWLYSQGFIATGYVMGLPAHSAAPAGGSVMPEQRHDQLQYRGLIRALSIGDRTGVTPAQWSLLRDTGTIHLMVVSGLHVSIFAGCAYGLLWGVLRLLVPLVGSAGCGAYGRLYALGFSLVAVLVYAVLTGLGSPVVRASAMAICVLLCLISTRRPGGLRLLGLVLLGFLLTWPTAGYAQGTWLSFGAVFWLLYLYQHRRRRFSVTAVHVLTQAALFIGMLPVLGVVIGAAPWVAPLANLCVVPVATLLAIPVSMAAVLIQEGVGAQFALPLLHIADLALHLIFYLLSNLPGAGIYSGTPRLPVVLLMVVGAMLALAPLGWALRLLGVVLCALLLLPPRVAVPWGQVWVDFIDVGQGSATLVHSARTSLLVDAGPSVVDGFDAGRDIINPVIRSVGRNSLQTMMISHSDLDHFGGAAAVASRYHPGHRLGGGFACQDGARWTADGVQFSVLRALNEDSNDGSCTLLIRAGPQQVYLNGDIGTNAEQRLLHRLSRVDVLLVPHHGSQTSSSLRFVARLRPQWAIYPAGFANRYGHPNERVAARYRKFSAVELVTGQVGMVRWQSGRPACATTQRSGTVCQPN